MGGVRGWRHVAHGEVGLVAAFEFPFGFLEPG